jgi:hypothetical protein
VTVTRRQCLNCHRFMIRDRAADGSDPQVCVECRATAGMLSASAAPGIPLRCDGDHAAPQCEDPQCWHLEGKDMPVFRHCDDYIDDPSTPDPLRKYLARARMPGHGMLTLDEYPRLFANHQGKRVRVVMASRFGDVGITSKLDQEFGYEIRVTIDQLDTFSETP